MGETISLNYSPDGYIEEDWLRSKVDHLFDELKHIKKHILKDESVEENNDYRCYKCGDKLPNRWEQQACSFTLNLYLDGQSNKVLWGESCKIGEGFNHPAIKDGSDFQKLIIKSGVNEEYKLCIKCHKKFIKLVGDFLRK